MAGRMTTSSQRVTPAQALTPAQRVTLVETYLAIPEEKRRAWLEAMAPHQQEMVEEVLRDHAGQQQGDIDYETPYDLERSIFPDRMNPPHLQLIDKIWQRIDAGESVRIIIQVAVRSGKSERCTRMGLAWWLNRNPEKRGIVLCHSESLSSQHSSFVRDMFVANPSLFSLRIDPAHSAADDWQFSGSPTGGVFATGVGGAVIGRGGDVIVIDDPVKSKADAESPAERQKVEDWYRGTIRSRLEPNGSMIIIMARWHDDDLVGRLLRDDPDDWEVLHLPAIAEDNDALGRKVGEALWPERYDEKALAIIKKDVGPSTWAAQYQNDPLSAAGTAKFDTDRIGAWAYIPGAKNYTLITKQPDGESLETLAFPVARFTTVDLGSKTKKSDFTVVSTWDLCQGGELCWIGCVFGRPHNQLGLIKHQHVLFGGKHPIIIESIGMQADYVIDAKRKGMPAHPISPKGDKVERSKLAQLYMSQRQIFVPSAAPWVAAAIKQLRGFPTANQDDIVDTVSYAAHIASGTGLGQSKETMKALAHISRRAA